MNRRSFTDVSEARFDYCGHMASLCRTDRRGFRFRLDDVNLRACRMQQTIRGNSEADP